MAESVIAVMAKNNIDAKDVRYVKMYLDYHRLKKEGHKINYVAAYLSEQYECGIATVYRVIKRMERAIE